MSEIMHGGVPPLKARKVIYDLYVEGLRQNPTKQTNK